MDARAEALKQAKIKLIDHAEEALSGQKGEAKQYAGKLSRELNNLKTQLQQLPTEENKENKSVFETFNRLTAKFSAKVKTWIEKPEQKEIATESFQLAL